MKTGNKTKYPIELFIGILSDYAQPLRAEGIILKQAGYIYNRTRYELRPTYLFKKQIVDILGTKRVLIKFNTRCSICFKTEEDKAIFILYFC